MVTQLSMCYHMVTYPYMVTFPYMDMLPYMVTHDNDFEVLPYMETLPYMDTLPYRYMCYHIWKRIHVRLVCPTEKLENKLQNNKVPPLFICYTTN